MRTGLDGIKIHCIIINYTIPLLPGSVVISEWFRSFWNFKNYYTPQTIQGLGISPTNTIEGSWNAVKYQIAPRNEKNSLNVVGNFLNHHVREFECGRKRPADL
ncbi:hypothetical protein HZS_7221 [Henneguya salminicola]|nr:hypothetical protein HZS_7221 [Henneguya salminicola]